ncbi:MAG: hypothetical protein H6601_08945 [Flavobacteriales bacterium]|nr:hypothetical protein [Flavobacteriales bacterium]
MKRVLLCCVLLISVGIFSRPNAQNVSSADALLDSVLRSSSKYDNPEKHLEALLGGLAVEEDVSNQEKLAQFYFILAFDLRKLGLQEQALHYIQRSVDCSKKAALDSNVVFYRVGTKLTYLLELGRGDSALIVAHEAHQYMHGRDSMYTAAALNNIGLCLLDLNDLETASIYFDSALAAIPKAMADHPQLIYLKMAIRDNLADVRERKGLLNEAKALVAQNINTLPSLPLIDHNWCSKLVNYSIRKARLEMRLEDWPAARPPLDSLRAFFRKHPERQTKEHDLVMAELERDLARQEQNIEAERLWSDTILSLKDRIDQERSASQLASIQRLSSITLDKTKQEFQKSLQLSDQKVRSRNLMLIVIALMSFLLIGSVYAVYKVRLQQRQMENQRLELELNHKNRDIGNLAMDISRRKEAAEEVLSYLEELKTAKKDKPERIDLATVERDLKKRIKADEKREWVHSQVEDINSSFYNRLRDKYPNLVPTEMELCAMIRSRMSNKQIAEIRNITPESASTARYRLGKKLGVPEGRDLVELLNEI